MCTPFYAMTRRFFRFFDASVHTERTRVQDAEEWGIDIERRIDRQQPAATRKSRDAQFFGDLIALHRQDFVEVGKTIGRSKSARLIFLDERLGHLRLPELDRDRLIKFGKERALEGTGPVTVGTEIGYIRRQAGPRRRQRAVEPAAQQRALLLVIVAPAGRAALRRRRARRSAAPGRREERRRQG